MTLKRQSPIPEGGGLHILTGLMLCAVEKQLQRRSDVVLVVKPQRCPLNEGAERREERRPQRSAAK